MYQYPVPPNPEAYTGSFEDLILFVNFTIFEKDGQLIAMFGSGFGSNIPLFLSYKEDGLFQVKLPPVLSCITYELFGANNEWIYFDEVDKSGKSPGFIFPGLSGLDKFHRT